MSSTKFGKMPGARTAIAVAGIQKNRAAELLLCCSTNFGESAGARTRDPNIKSVVLYRLSYGFSEPKAFAFGGAKIVNIFILPK